MKAHRRVASESMKTSSKRGASLVCSYLGFCFNSLLSPVIKAGSLGSMASASAVLKVRLSPLAFTGGGGGGGLSLLLVQLRDGTQVMFLSNHRLASPEFCPECCLLPSPGEPQPKRLSLPLPGAFPALTPWVASNCGISTFKKTSSPPKWFLRPSHLLPSYICNP